MKRKIVEIDREKCNGCGNCVPSCAEGAIQIVAGKAVVGENLCDGLGACLGECPRKAIRIVERDVDSPEEKGMESLHGGMAVGSSLSLPSTNSSFPQKNGSGCPGSRMVSRKTLPVLPREEKSPTCPSRLAQWPVQLSLVPVDAPFFENADLLVAADCVPFAYADFHRDFLDGKALLVGCPKLDDNDYYTEKLTDIFRRSSLGGITVVRMAVPCCGGIEAAVKRALVASGKTISLKVVTIGLDGSIR